MLLISHTEDILKDDKLNKIMLLQFSYDINIQLWKLVPWIACLRARIGAREALARRATDNSDSRTFGDCLAHNLQDALRAQYCQIANNRIRLWKVSPMRLNCRF